MDALKNIVANVPDWLKRLDELGTQIDQRQAELAALGSHSSGRSIKNKGSTESLKLRDIDDADTPIVDAPVFTEEQDLGKPSQPDGDHADPVPPSSPGSSHTPSALQRHTQQAMAVAQARARAQVKKRYRTDSVISAENGHAKYRSRSMIIVYYDKYVQEFFEELVKFVSASRNLMRKAKMAAKVAQIRRLAEVSGPSDDGDGSKPVEPDPNETLPSLRYMSGRRMGPGPRTAMGSPRFGRSGPPGGLLGSQEKDAYDDLDKGLEFVQSMCEHAAHQFLRDGDCTDEISKIQSRLAEAKDLADKELERVEREDPDLLKEGGEAGKARTHRPASMRRELAAAGVGKDKCSAASSPLRADSDIKADGDGNHALEEDDALVADPATPAAAVQTKPSPSPAAGGGLLAADDAPLEADDEGVEDMELTLSKLQYRSTRRMGRPRADI